jgi:putative nucleotidyltransferase with HDIG domain
MTEPEQRRAMSKLSLDLRTYFPEIDRISDAALRKGVEAVWDRLWQESPWNNVEDVTLIYTAEHTQIRHAQSVLRSALAMADIAEEVHGVVLDRDLLIAGALLMDACKLVEYEPSDDGTRLSEVGRKLQHAAYGAHLALEEGLPLDVAHIILTHSPQSPMTPKVPEGMLLQHLDLADTALLGGDKLFARSVMDYLKPR